MLEMKKYGKCTLAMWCVVLTITGCSASQKEQQEQIPDPAEARVQTEVTAATEASPMDGERAETAETKATEEEAPETEEKGVLGDEVIAGWHIVTENVQINQSLENMSVALGYSGVQTSEFAKEAEEGNTFCLVRLLIEKQGSRERIEWEKMCLTDEEGNVYHRLEDAFILDLGMKRMAGTTLNFGSNEGWIAYEIPQNAKGLTISYAFENETYSCALTG